MSLFYHIPHQPIERKESEVHTLNRTTSKEVKIAIDFSYPRNVRYAAFTSASVFRSK